MGNILEKMAYQVPGSFKSLYILLSADMAIPPMYLRITIQAVFLGALF